MNENRITGPGYYPKRPTPQVKENWFPLTPGPLSVKLFAGTYCLGDLRWRGSGRYSFKVCTPWAQHTATRWIIGGQPTSRGGYREAIYTNPALMVDILNPVQLPIGEWYSVMLYSPTPTTTSEDAGSSVWKFEPVQP